MTRGVDVGELDEAVRGVNDLRAVGQQLTGFDAATWRTASVDRSMRSTVVAVLLFEHAPDWKRLRARFDRLTRMVPVLRERPLFGAVGVSAPRMAVDPEFDLDIHLRRFQLIPGSGWGEVLAEARRMSLTDFDHARPLWEAVLVEGLPDGRAAIIMKLHHAIADGQGAVLIGLNLFEFTPDGNPDEPEAPPAPIGEDVSITSVSKANIQDNLSRAFDAAVKGAKIVADFAVGSVKAPQETIGEAVDMASSLGKFAAVPESSLSPLMNRRSDMYRFATFELPFDEIKRISKERGDTVNDTFLGAVTTGLAAYHERHGKSAEQLRFNIPISLRKTVKDGSSANAVTIARLELPVSDITIRERIDSAHDEVRRWRDEPALTLVNPLAEASWVLPVPMLASVARTSDITVSNVPGPPVPIYVGGAQLIGTWPLVPTVGAAANITLVTYDGTAYIGVSADQAAVPDIEDFIGDLRAGFDRVLAGKPAGVTNDPGETAVKQKARRAKHAAGTTARVAKASAKRVTRSSNKSTAKKSTAKKSTAKKSTAKKSTAKKSTAKKSTAKKK
ncbi:MAG: WS/DGAT domain-containing protein [Actinomycetia bacterium]|nr:WS/DGAT domain-containing protein [Actinomycetes bacterium]